MSDNKLNSVETDIVKDLAQTEQQKFQVQLATLQTQVEKLSTQVLTLQSKLKHVKSHMPFECWDRDARKRCVECIKANKHAVERKRKLLGKFRK